MLNDRQVRKTFELLEIPLKRMNESSPIYIPCPYQEKHTKPTRARDCQLYFNDGPNIFCFHESCREALRELCDFVRFEVTGSNTNSAFISAPGQTTNSQSRSSKRAKR